MKLKKFLKKQRITVMLVQNTGGSVRQVKLNAIFVYALIAAVLLTFTQLTWSHISSSSEIATLNQDKETLEATLLMEQDKNRSLEAIVETYDDQIKTLKSSLAENVDITKSRLQTISETENKLLDLISIFNEQTGSELAFSRSAETRDAAIDGLSQDEIIQKAVALSYDDEVTKKLVEKQESLDALKDDLASQLDYIDARPDMFPTQGIITSYYGYRADPFTGVSKLHKGLDIAAPLGTNILAAGSGSVVYAGFMQGFGYMVILDHGYGYTTAYGHLNSIHVEEGQYVSKGEVIAAMGSTGYSTGSHLHFEIRYQGVPFDPLTMLNY